MRFVCVVAAPALAALAALGVGVAAPGPAYAASAEKGKTVFVQNGCWQCHGYEGQGSVATSGGRVVADTQLPLDAFKAYVRAPTGAMPPFREAILSDADLDDIYAYLESRPKPISAKDIPLLDQLK
jgi:ubiquinol-cytochrome c reductase cytochrome c subunit